MVDQASLQHYQRLNTYLSNPTPDWLTTPVTFEAESIIDDKPRYPLSKLISDYQEESQQKGHSQKTKNKYAQCLALAIIFHCTFCVAHRPLGHLMKIPIITSLNGVTNFIHKRYRTD